MIDGVLPLLGFLTAVWLWTSLTGTNFKVGLIWLGAGIDLLGWVTRGVTHRPPELHLDASKEDMESGPGVAELGRLGAARVTFGGTLHRLATDALRDIAERVTPRARNAEHGSHAASGVLAPAG